MKIFFFLNITFLIYGWKQFPTKSEPASCPSLIEPLVRIMSLPLPLPRRSIPKWTPKPPMLNKKQWVDPEPDWSEIVFLDWKFACVSGVLL